MKAIVLTDQAAGTAAMTLVERPGPQAAIIDVVVEVHASLSTNLPRLPPMLVREALPLLSVGSDGGLGPGDETPRRQTLQQIACRAVRRTSRSRLPREGRGCPNLPVGPLGRHTWCGTGRISLCTRAHT
jgi:hypothetical protein